MSDTNPYAPPNAIVADPLSLAGDEPELAGRWARLGAAFIDGLVAMAIACAVLIPLYGADGLMMLGRTPFSFIGGLAVNYAIIGLVQGWFLYQRSQTIGKMALGLRIVRPDNSHADLPRLLLRLAIMTLNGIVPYIGKIFGIVDILFIFGASRRCLHDLIADTIVVTAATSEHATLAGARAA